VTDIIEYIKPYKKHAESYPPSYTTSTSWQTKASIPVTLKPGTYCMSFSTQFLAPAGGTQGDIALGFSGSPLLQSREQAITVSTTQICSGCIRFVLTSPLTLTVDLLYKSASGGSFGVSMSTVCVEEM